MDLGLIGLVMIIVSVAMILSSRLGKKVEHTDTEGGGSDPSEGEIEVRVRGNVAPIPFPSDRFAGAIAAEEEDEVGEMTFIDLPPVPPRELLERPNPGRMTASTLRTRTARKE